MQLMKVEWEEIGYNLHRTQVPGGWLVKQSSNVLTHYHTGFNPQDGYEWRESIAYVPDPTYSWLSEI